MRAFIRTIVGAAVIISALAFAGSVSAESGGGLPVESSYFEVPGTNGYTLYLESQEGHALLVLSRTRPAGMTTFSAAGAPRKLPGGPYSQVTYYASQPRSDPNEVSVDLGACDGQSPCGHVAVKFAPNGETKVTSRRIDHPQYKCDSPAVWTRHLGTFTGTIALRGENGFTTVSSTNVIGSVGSYKRPRGCKHLRRGKVRAGAQDHPGSRWLLLTAKSKQQYFFAWRSRGKTTFHASSSETLPGSDGVIIIRDAQADGPASLVDSGVWQVAVRPPAPFKGLGVLRARPNGATSWTGRIAVIFPGITTRLAGPGIRGFRKEGKEPE